MKGKAVDTDKNAPKRFRFSELIQITLISLYCAALIIGPILYLRKNISSLFPSDIIDELHILELTILMGIMGSALRGISRLFTDTGKGDYQPSWNLSILMRPLEGAGIALVAYLAIRAGILLVEQGTPRLNPIGLLFVGVLSGMFSHRAADNLRDRFDSFWGKQGPSKADREEA
jgi:hypothetical protein